MAEDFEVPQEHHIVDCSYPAGDQEFRVALDDEEKAEYIARHDEWVRERDAKEESDRALREAVRGHSDPVVQELAKILGMV
jgi:hypothetical protein